jgi:membrane protease YdiL (CAAX protease family)
VIGCAYLLSGRNLWTAILAHGIQVNYEGGDGNDLMLTVVP